MFGSVSQSFFIVISQLSVVLGDFYAHSCLRFPIRSACRITQSSWNFDFPVNACRGDVSNITIFEIQLLFLGKVKPKTPFTSLLQTCRLAVNVFYLALKKRHSFLDDNSACRQKKENMEPRCKAHLLATWKFCSSISDSINIFPWEILQDTCTAERFPCQWERRRCGWCATSMSGELLVPSQFPASMQQETETRYSVLRVMCAGVKMSKKAQSPLYFHLLYHLEGRRSLWMNCLKNVFPQISIIFVFVHRIRRHLCLALSTWCISSIPRTFAFPL